VRCAPIAGCAQHLLSYVFVEPGVVEVDWSLGRVVVEVFSGGVEVGDAGGLRGADAAEAAWVVGVVRRGSAARG
jgi:hypothetical protein